MTDQSSLTDKTVLVGDIGGTHSRLALAKPDNQGGFQLDKVRISSVQDFSGMQGMLVDYQTHINASLPADAVISVAGPVFGNTIDKSLSNLPWTFSIEELKSFFSFQQLHVVNDFAALAAAIPYLSDSETETIKYGTAQTSAPRVIIGPGTGLGAAALVKHNNQWLSVASEGGNITLAASTPLQQQVLAILKKQHDHVSAETVLSGMGLVELYQVLCEIEGKTPQNHTPETIGNSAINKTDDSCVKTVSLFFDWLACVAADLALCFCATGGVFIGGGIPPKLKSLIEQQDFSHHFTNKGGVKAYLDPIPVSLITHPYPALIGAAALSGY